jgi:DNA-binding MarR family transcriptional regulator
MPRDEGTRAFSKADYEAVAAFRYALRRFLRFSDDAARRHGLTPQQHQLLLAVKGYPGRDWATIGELAERLQRRHHTVVGEIDRAERAGLVTREAHPDDRRVVEIHLTPSGEAVLAALTAVHRDELRGMHDALRSFAIERERPPGTGG